MTGRENKTEVRLEGDLDALFKLPLTEFTAARNALAARLRKLASGVEAERVKALVKPSVSAWAVNQLYWNHQDGFNGLMTAGERLRRAHASQLSGKATDTREALAERREALSALSRLAGALLQDAGHNPSPDTMRRITTTLEALSTLSSLSDATRPGRLTQDVDPPGFEALVTLIPSGGRTERPVQPAQIVPFKQSARAAASAKAAFQAAERFLRETRTIAQNRAAALKKATALANATEKTRLDAQERFETAASASEEARQLLNKAAAEAATATKALEDAKRQVEKAREEIKGQTENMRGRKR